MSRAGVTSIALSVCLVGAALRFKLAAHNVEAPLIDEGEVVEQAVAFMGGELRHRFLKYGPLMMYVLAAIYRGVAAVRGMSALEYASRVFFEGSEHYCIARSLAACSLIGTAWLAFVSFRRSRGTGPALLVCCLLGLPCVDGLYSGVRVDVPQAAFQTLTLLALGELVGKPRTRSWLIAGACAGLAIASKPLPGLLVLPCFALASWFLAAKRSDGSDRPWLARLGATLACPGLALAVLACIGCAILGDPAILEIRAFVNGQEQAIALHSSAEEVHRRLTVLQSLAPLGLPFLICSGVAALIAVVKRDPRCLLVVSFLVIYLAAFWGRGSRPYFMIAPAMAGCLLIGYAYASLSQFELRSAGQRWRQWCWVPLLALLGAVPARSYWVLTNHVSAPSQAGAWFHEHVPSGTPVFVVGRRPESPRLVGTNEKLQAKWGGHFNYGRDKYEFLKRAFHKAFSDYAASDKPRYPLEVYRSRPAPRSKRMPRKISDSLFAKAQARGQRYIVIAGFRERDVSDLHYRWFGQAILEQQFGGIAIFRVPERAKVPSKETVSAAAPSAG